MKSFVRRREDVVSRSYKKTVGSFSLVFMCCAIIAYGMIILYLCIFWEIFQPHKVSMMVISLRAPLRSERNVDVTVDA